ncbi:MAG: hypothetical protein FD170_1186, partial [Bacteroidetes bacterium]
MILYEDVEQIMKKKFPLPLAGVKKGSTFAIPITVNESSSNGVKKFFENIFPKS